MTEQTQNDLNTLLSTPGSHIRGTIIEGKPPEPGHIVSNGFSVRYSGNLGALAEALAKAQLEFQPVLKQSENPAFRRGKGFSKYADLNSVIEATRPALAKHGLVVIQLPQVLHETKMLKMTTKLLHASGEWIENDLVVPATQMQGRYDIQSIGSAMTYTRRYAWQAIVGVAAEEDDDGNAAAGVGSQDAANAVAKEKIDKAVASGVAALFYTWDDAEQQGHITGDQKLLIDNKELLLYKGKLSKDKKSIIVDAAGLEDLKYELDQRGVIFRPLKGTEVQEVLRESINQAKAKKADAQ